MPKLVDALYLAAAAAEGGYKGWTQEEERRAKKREKEEKSLYKLLANMEKQEEKRKKEVSRQIKLKQTEDKILKSKEWPILGKIFEDPRRKELRDEIEELVRIEQGLDDAEHPMSLKHSETKSSTKTHGSGGKKIRPKGPKESHLTDEEYEQGQRLLQWFTGGSPSDAIKSVPSGALEIGEGVAGLAGAKGAKQKIRSAKEKYEDAVGVDRDNFWAAGGRFGGEFIPLGVMGKLAKYLPWLNRAAKALPRGVKTVGSGSAYGAIDAERNDQDPVKGGIIGGGLSLGTHLVGKGITKAQGHRLDKIKKRAKITNPKEVLARAEVMGEEALIPELVGDEKYINRLKHDTSKANIDRMEKVETNIRNHAKGVSKKLPQGKDIELYKQLEKQAGSAKEKGTQLYDITKESGIGRHGVLEKPFIEEWMNIVKESKPHIKGLPSLKPGAPKHSIDKLQNALLGAPSNNEAYKAFAIQYNDIIPTPTDFLKFRGRVKKMLEKADASNVNELTELYRKLDTLIEKVDPESNLAKARYNWATEVAPFSESSIKKARDSVRFQDNIQGRPKVSEVFKKRESSKAFEKLSSQDKEKVLGGFLEEILEREEVSPERAVQELWKNLPQYIKRTNDPQIQNLLKQIRAQGHLNKTTSSLQQATTASIGSRVAVRAKKLRQPVHAYSIFTGDLTPSAVIGATELGLKGANKARKKAFRNRMGQKNLKHYLNPELLDEIIRKKKFKHRHRVPIQILSSSNREEDF